MLLARLFLPAFLGWVAVAAAADYYVSQAPGAADDNPGSAAKPWRTLAKAGAAAKAGDTVHIAAGVYRDYLKIMNSGSAEAPITFVGEGPGEVLVSGAEPVSGFVREGKLWTLRPWPHKFKWYWGEESTYPEVANDNAPFKSSGRMENVFINGAPLQWVPEKKDLAPGRFYWAGDPAEGKGELLIAPPEGLSDPTAVQLEIPRRACVLSGAWGSFPRGISEVRSLDKEGDAAFPKGDYIVLRGLSFGYTCEGFVTAGALVTGDHWTVEDCRFRYMNASGLWLGGNQPVVRRCTFTDNGKTGLSSKFGLAGGLIEDCVVLRNNRKFYKIAWDAGGVKLHNTTDTTVRRLLTACNYGSAVWFDMFCERNTVEDSIVLGNEGLALFYEISDRGTFRRNVSFGSGAGLQYAHSANGDLSHNEIIGCSTGYVVGGDREKYKCLNNTFSDNLVVETRGKNVGWKWSKQPDGRTPSSKNLIEKNLFVTVNGSTEFEMYRSLPDLAAFQQEYTNATNNQAVSGLDKLDKGSAQRLDAAFDRIGAALARIVPEAGFPSSGLHLEAIWRLGGERRVDGYWLRSPGGPLLILVGMGNDRLALVSPGAAKVALWRFPHLGAPQTRELTANGLVYSLAVDCRLSVITGLGAGTTPPNDLVRLASSQAGKAKRDFREGEEFQAEVNLANPFPEPLPLKIGGPGLEPRELRLAPGENKRLTANLKAAAGVETLVYRLESPVLGLPLDAGLDLHVTRVAPVARQTPALAVRIDSPAQRNVNVWDEVTGKTWTGLADLSGTAALGWTDEALEVHLAVSDDQVLPGRHGLLSGDSFEMFLDGRGAKTQGRPEYSEAVLHLRVAPPSASDWSALTFEAGRPFFANGDFRDGLNNWFLPGKTGATVVAEAGESFVRLEGSHIIQRDLPLDPKWGRIRVSCRARYDHIVAGSKSWHQGRLNLEFKDAKDKHAGAWPEMISFKGSQADWKTEAREYEIPADATKVRVQAGMWEVKSGRLDLDDIVLLPIADRQGQPLAPPGCQGIEVTGRRTATGYEAKVKIAWSRYPELTSRAGTAFGFDLVLNDSDRADSLAPQTQLVWQGTEGHDSSDPSRFGLLRLEK